MTGWPDFEATKAGLVSLSNVEVMHLHSTSTGGALYTSWTFMMAAESVKAVQPIEGRGDVCHIGRVKNGYLDSRATEM